MANITIITTTADAATTATTSINTTSPVYGNFTSSTPITANTYATTGLLQVKSSATSTDTAATSTAAATTTTTTTTSPVYGKYY